MLNSQPANHKAPSEVCCVICMRSIATFLQTENSGNPTASNHR
jgi:hypothetical protein